MALSDYERKMLEELEAQLSDSDPKFAETIAPENPTATRLALSVKNMVIGLVIAVVGIGVLIAGVMIEIIPVGFLGVIIMGVGFWYATSGMTSKEVPVTGKTEKKWPTAKDSFMNMQNSMWNQRKDGEGPR